MKCKVKIMAGLFLLTLMVSGRIQGVYAQPVQGMEEEAYVRVDLGGGYLGKTILYDRERERTLVRPNDGENKTVIRNKEDVTVFYGKYRGKDEFEKGRKNFPETDIGFFQMPIDALGLEMSEIQANDYQIAVVEQEKTEPFLTALSYAGVIDNEVFTIAEVDLLYDEFCRPLEVRFKLASESAQEEQRVFVEDQLSQKFEYITKEVFEESFSEIENKIREIKPLKEVDVVDYIDELSNVVKIVDEHFLLVLQAQTKELVKTCGWDKPAVFAYLESVDYKFGRFGQGYEGQQITQEEYLEELDRVYETAHLVGSDIYTYMFESSELKPKKKALLVIKQMGGYLDSNGMLQLEDRESFYLEMTPHSEFLEAYAATVREAYVRKNKTCKRLDDQKIHQFRMYIDRHNIEYVRNFFEGRTDYEKLLNYAKEFGFSLYYGEPSRHHNKILQDGQFVEQTYDKILTPNRLSEFIINVETGDFVTEWDVLKDGAMKNVVSSSVAYRTVEETGAMKLVDTESFNYAPADYVEAHEKLDVLPASPGKKKDEKLYLENALKKQMKEMWKSPDREAYKEKYRTPKDYLK